MSTILLTNVHLTYSWKMKKVKWVFNYISMLTINISFFCRGKCTVILDKVQIPLKLEEHKYFGENPRIKGNNCWYQFCFRHSVSVSKQPRFNKWKTSIIGYTLQCISKWPLKRNMYFSTLSSNYVFVIIGYWILINSRY